MTTVRVRSLRLAALEAQPFRVRLTATFAAVALLHVVGAVLLAVTVITAPTAGLTAVGLAGLVYGRGLVHAFDFDHVSMIDGSTRKLVTEGHRPASVGLAFSAGHSTVVIITGVLVVAGADAIRTVLDPASPAAGVLGAVGLAVSGTYLLLVAVANAAAFRTAWQLRSRLRRDPAATVPADALTPRGPAAVIMTAPLKRVRRPVHVYLIGMLFSLGFDTSSQVGLLILTASAALAGTPPIALLALPFLFAAAMTLADSVNGVMMLKMYESAVAEPAAKLRFNLLITGVTIVSATCIAVLSGGALVRAAGGADGVSAALADVDTTFVGYGLVAFFAVVGLLGLAVRRPAGAERR